MRIKFGTLQRIISEALENAYEVLGVPPGASKREILKAWRGLVHDLRAKRGGGRGGLEGQLINYYGRAVRAALANVTDPAIPPEFEPRMVKAPTLTPVSTDAGLGADDDVPFEVPKRAAGKAKEDYKVYGKYGPQKRSVVRVQGDLFGTGPEGILSTGNPTMFRTGDRVGVEFDPELDGRLRVYDGEHDQVWEPVDEVRRIVDEVIIESLLRGEL